MTQTRLVSDALARAWPQLHFEIQAIRTEGDRLAHVSLSKIGGRGIFVKEIEHALLAGKIDLAVHSLKDLPSTLPSGLTIAAIPLREDARDVLIARNGLPLTALPPGATLATSSPRRFAQLRAARPDLRFVDLRGNVDTRLRRLHAGDFDAIVLAAAGVLRLGRGGEVTEYLPLDLCLPAVGQGALAVEVRADDADLLKLLSAVDHPRTRAAVTAERAFLRTLGGGCRVPIAAYADVSPDGTMLRLHGRILAPDGSERVEGVRSGPATAAEQTGEDLGRELLEQARPLLEAAEAKGLALDLPLRVEGGE